MREPGDRVALAAAGRMLDQIVMPHALSGGCRHHLAHRLQLVVARKDQVLLAQLLAVVAGLLFHVEMQEAREQVEQAVALQHFFPHIGRLVVASLGVGRVAGAAVHAAVEGQEVGGRTGQARGHVRLFGIHREMHQRAPGEHEDRFARVAVVAVLVDGVGGGLAAERVLQLQRHQRDAVHRQRHIQRLFRLRAEVQLPREPQPIGPVARLQFRVKPVRRAEKGDAQGLAETLEAVAQRGQRAMNIQPLAQRLQHPRAGVLAVQCLELVPHLALGGADEGQRLVGEERALAVEALCGHPRVAPGQQDRLDGGLESGFGRSFARHHSALVSGCSRWCAVRPHLSTLACRPAR